MLTEQRKKFLNQWLQEFWSSDYTDALASQIATLTPDEYSYLFSVWITRKQWRIGSPSLREVATEIKSLDLTFALSILEYPWWEDDLHDNVTSVVYDIIVANNLATNEDQQQAVHDAFHRFFRRYPLSAGKEFWYFHFDCSETFASCIWGSLSEEVKATL